MATVHVAEGTLDLEGVIVWHQRVAWQPWVLAGVGLLLVGWLVAHRLGRRRHG